MTRYNAYIKLFEMIEKIENEKDVYKALSVLMRLYEYVATTELKEVKLHVVNSLIDTYIEI